MNRTFHASNTKTVAARVTPWKRTAVLILAGFALAIRVVAGGSGLNVAVVVNQNSSNSVELGNYYCEKRGVPSQNVLRISWPGGNADWTASDFDTFLRTPLSAMLASRRLTNQIEVVLLSMDIPYRVTLTTGSSATSGINSTTAALFYGFQPDGCATECPEGFPSCNLAPGSTNRYAGSEGVFRQAPPINTMSNSWLVMMLTSSNLTQAKAVVERGLASDGSLPTQRVYLAKSEDVNRNVRYALYDNALFNIQVDGVLNAMRTNTDTTFGLGDMLGYANGSYALAIYGGFAPGAMADSLTSFGGKIFEDSGHTDALDFLNAGATASYGTVVEPCAYLQKFPAPQNYFYQARGFSMAECYYQSLTNPYQGLLVGEPLAAPFAQPCQGNWSQPLAGAVISGTTNLTLNFSSLSTDRPVQIVDLFVDDQWAGTITNVPPRTNNILYVTLNGFRTNYAVPANASLRSVTSNLVLRLNEATYRNATRVAAFAHGDRIELQGLDAATPGAAISVAVSNHIGSAAVLTSFIRASRTNLLDTEAYGLREYAVVGSLAIGDYLKLTGTKTNGAGFSVAFTNQSGSATFAGFVQSFLAAVNADPSLQAADGVIAEDLVTGILADEQPYGQFNLRVRSPGIAAAQLQVWLTGSFTISPTTTLRLEGNLADLRPRNHLYLTAGLTNLSLTFPFNTATSADGYHQLTVVAYEGSHVRTQKRISQNVRIQNNSWSADFTMLLGDTNTALEATLQFAVFANTNNIAKIELFTTGGLFAISNNVAATTFAVGANYLGVGLHPFFALITRSDGKQYRTETKWVRIVGAEPLFNVSALGPAPLLTWPAIAGRAYRVLSATSLADTFIPRAVVTPTNSIGRWSETNHAAPERYYRVASP
ncbi:MAG: TIGR03790 family protein [Verrucomicrobia subdivision 3 bacterium]|nr:TIGR03790 family protein [Verrucomicrobiota bacterium]MCC6822559.1 TIGR03790 family protein [Limisphaerales bacterium]